MVRRKILEDEYVITKAGIKARLPINYYDYYGIPKSRRGYVLACLLPITITDPSKFMIEQEGACCIIDRCFYCKKIQNIVVWIRWMMPWFRCLNCLKAQVRYTKKHKS